LALFLRFLHRGFRGTPPPNSALADDAQLTEYEVAAVAKRMQTGACQIPVIGGEFPPPEYRGDLKQR
jgi:hypothetical protein